MMNVMRSALVAAALTACGANVDVPQLRGIGTTGGHAGVRMHVFDGTSRDLIAGSTGRVLVEDI